MLGQNARFNSKARNQKTDDQKKLSSNIKTDVPDKEGTTINQGDKLPGLLLNDKDDYQTVSEANPVVLPQKNKTEKDGNNVIMKKRKSKEITLSKNQKRKLKQVIDRKKKSAKVFQQTTARDISPWDEPICGVWHACTGAR